MGWLICSAAVASGEDTGDAVERGGDVLTAAMAGWGWGFYDYDYNGDGDGDGDGDGGRTRTRTTAVMAMTDGDGDDDDGGYCGFLWEAAEELRGFGRDLLE